jgi:isopentenyldiphosphate isomerase
MAEEIVVRVDSRNRRPRPVARSRVIADRLTHRGIVVLALNSRGQVFLQRRSERKKVYGGHWDASCAGTVGWGESFAQCAVRELAEELTLHVNLSQLKRLGRPYRVTTDQTDEFDQLFTVQSEGQFSLQRGEVSEGKWVSIGAVPRILEEDRVTPWFSQGWELFERKGAAGRSRRSAARGT